jgi:hypothetical protein
MNSGWAGPITYFARKRRATFDIVTYSRYINKPLTMGIFASDTRQYFARKIVATHEKPSISFEDAKANLTWTKTDRGSDSDLNKPHSIEQ